MKFKAALVETLGSKNSRNAVRFGSYEDNGYRAFSQVDLPNEVKLSIQASYGHYCTPRKTLPVEDYTTMEMAVFLKNEWSSVVEVTQNEKLIAKFNAYSDGSVYGYVPVELIEELYQELNQTN